MPLSQNIYNNKPNNIATTRIQFDIDQINKDNDILDKELIYFKFCTDENINTKYHQMLVGPSDTPYSGGYYIFEGQFPDIYPFQPMKMKSLTQGGDVRKHPNLYRCGKCCFSFLGTWSGPPWTPCQNARTVASSMRSVLTKMPLENEPGFENVCEKKNEHEKYAYLIGYFNLKYAICNILENIDNPPNVYFKDKILKLFRDNYSNYILELLKYDKDNGKKINSPVYQFNLLIDTNDLRKRFIDLKEKYI
tara:strand:+ start:200 stop:946 length:747 start_codon:yes stop_codon:yes gene_type:complete